jgi:hypothetical protein
MNIEQLLSAASRIEGLLVEKGYIAPSVTFRINWMGHDLCGSLSYQVSESISSEKNMFPKATAADGWEPIIAIMEDHINSLIPIKEAKNNEFIAAIGRLIDQGREIDIDVEYLNPLTEMMGKLSTNILTDQE